MQVQSVVDESAALPHTQKRERRKDLLMYLDVLCGYVFSSASSVTSSSKLNANISQPAGIADRFYGALGGLRFEKS